MNPTGHYVTGSRSSSSFDCFSQGASLFVSVFQLYVNILIIKSLFNSSSIVASFMSGSFELYLGALPGLKPRTAHSPSLNYTPI